MPVGTIMFLNTRSCGTIQQLDLLDRYLTEYGVEYAVISDPRLTATSPMASRNYELFADEKSMYYVCFAVRRRIRHQGHKEPELQPIAERAVALHVPDLKVELLAIYGMPVTKSHTDNDRRLSWAELHMKILDQLQGSKFDILAGGDLNAHMARQQLTEGGHLECGRCSTRVTDANGKAVLAMCKELRLRILNYEFPAPCGDHHTYVGNAAIRSSTVDFVCVSENARGRVNSLRLTSGRPPHRDMTDHRGILVQWTRVTRNTARECFQPKACPFSDDGAATPGTPEAKYEELQALLKPTKPLKEAANRTKVLGPSEQMQRLLDRRATHLGLTADDVRESQIAGIDREIEELTAREERRLWEAIERELDEAYASGKTASILKVVERYFGAPKRKVYTSKKSQEALAAHMKSVVSPEVIDTDDPVITLQEADSDSTIPQRVEDWTDEGVGGLPEEVYTDTSFGLMGAKHPLTWAVASEGGRSLCCGPVPYETFGTREPTVRNGEDWAIMEALARRQQRPLRIHTDSKHSVREHENWGKAVRSEFQKTEGGDTQLLRTTHGFKRGRRVEVVHEDGHAIGTLNYMAHVGARYAAARGKTACALTMPDGMTWARACNKYNTERELWGYMDTWQIIPAGTVKLDTTRVLPQRMDDSVPTREETKLALDDVPANVAEGYDDIRRRDLQTEEQLNALHALIVSIWENRTLPHKLRRCLMVCVAKDKSAPLGPANCRGLSLLSVVVKVLNNIIMRRLQRLPLADTQIGFVPGHNGQQGIQIIKALIEVLRNEGPGAILIFVDLHKAFDCVSRANMRFLLMNNGFSDTAAELLLQLWEHEIVLRFPNGEFSEAFHPTRGTMQGLGLSPIIFTMVMEAVLQQTHTRGVSFYSKRTGRLHCFKHMTYADDLVVVCKDAASAMEFMDALALSLKKFGLTINTKKTKIMNVVKKPEPDSRVTVAQSETKAVQRGDHASQHQEAMPTGLVVRRSIASYFGGSGKNTMVIKYKRGADAVVCPHPRCGIVFAVLNKRTGLAYTSPITNRMLLHLQELHHVEAVEAEPVHDVSELQQRNCVEYPWPPAPLYTPELWEKLSQFDRRIQVQHAGAVLEVVAIQKYLGALIDATDDMDPEVGARVAAGNRAFFKMPRGLWTSGISRARKVAVYRSVVMSVVMFGAEAWVTTGEQEKRLDRLMTTHLRTVLGMHGESIPETWDSTRCDFRLQSAQAVWTAAKLPRIRLLTIRARLRLAGQWVRMHEESELLALAHVTTMQGRRSKWWTQVELDLVEVGMPLIKAKNKVDWEKALKRLGRKGGSGAYVTGGSRETDGSDGEDHAADEDTAQQGDGECMDDDEDDAEAEWDAVDAAVAAAWDGAEEQ